jgi:hypothetical protein
MSLRPSRDEGRFVDAQEEVVAFDPSVRERGPSALLVEPGKITGLLKQGGYCLVWIVCGEKTGTANSLSSTDGWLNVMGVYHWGPGGAEGKHRSWFTPASSP